MKPTWLNTAIFYEIYPQSFQDSNGDGIGDFEGIRRRLDALLDLGVNAIWMNPCFDSSFYDAGYDVRDYCKTAARYGSTEDLKRLFEAIHQREMHILLDHIPGHTAIDHPWFRKSCLVEQNDCTDRYIWRSGGPWGQSYRGIASFLCGISERPGAVAVNCFSTQPALNYGFGTVTEDWQFSADSPEAEQTRLLMQDVMRFWLDLGCDGFRVDMAGSLVKEDEEQRCTMRVWQKVREFLDREYPEAVLISEWGNPEKALKAGFHMDFLLHTGSSHYLDLFRDRPYFSAGGRGDPAEFVNYYSDVYEKTKADGFICIPSGNHDMVRMRETLTPAEMKLAFTFLLTMPGCPFLYYGDEIGMRYVRGLKSKEGGYERTGSRTPMQWDRSKNAGFSDAERDALYLPIDPDPERPNWEDQKKDPRSLWTHVQNMIRFRKAHSALQRAAEFRFLTDGTGGRPLVYERRNDAERLLIALNPSAESAVYSGESGRAGTELLYSCRGARVEPDGSLLLPPGSCAVLSE